METGEFRLVAESTRERNLLLRNAPHFVKALPTVVPIHSIFRGIVPSVKRFLGFKAKLADRGLAIVEAGLTLYDLLGLRHRVMPGHTVALRRKTRRRFPAMAPSVIATSTYYDARVTQAERLCFELVADGEAAHPAARALNYMAVSGAGDGRVTLTDQITGETVRVEPRVVVNAAGPWIDLVNRAVGIEEAYIGGTKGSHLVVDNAELVGHLDGQMVYFGSSDGRICLVYPFFGPRVDRLDRHQSGRSRRRRLRRCGSRLHARDGARSLSGTNARARANRLSLRGHAGRFPQSGSTIRPTSAATIRSAATRCRAARFPCSR